MLPHEAVCKHSCSHQYRSYSARANLKHSHISGVNQDWIEEASQRNLPWPLWSHNHFTHTHTTPDIYTSCIIMAQIKKGYRCRLVSHTMSVSEMHHELILNSYGVLCTLKKTARERLKPQSRSIRTAYVSRTRWAEGAVRLTRVEEGKRGTHTV